MNVYAQDSHIHWREQAMLLKKNIKTGDAVVISTASDLLPFLYYFGDPPGKALDGYDKSGYCKRNNGSCSALFYEKTNGITGIPHDMGEGATAIMNMTQGRLETLIRRRPMTVWLLASRWTGIEREKYLVSWLSRRYRLAREEKGPGIHVYRFERIPSQQVQSFSDSWPGPNGMKDS
jgi:hypothetical protein